MNKKILLLAYFSLLWWGAGSAQTFDIKKISTNEGLPAGQIVDIVQDRDGLIWLSTYEGLVKLNGTENQVFNTKNGLRNNLISNLFWDSRNQLWVSMEAAGVGIFQKDSMKYLRELSALDSLTVVDISESKDGRIWFSTYGQGIFIWDGDKLAQITVDEGLPSNYTWNLYHHTTEETWIGMWSGVAILKEDSIRSISTKKGLSGLSVYNFAEDKFGNIWASTSNGVAFYNGTNWETIRSINGDELGYVFFVLVDQKGTVWIATERNGVYLYEDGEYIHINKSNGLSSNYIYSLFEDKEGRVWVATNENGVNILRDRRLRIFNEPEFVYGESVNSIIEHDGNLWLGTEFGITKFREEGNSEHFSIPENIVDYQEVWDIESLPNGNLLILNNNSQLVEFDGKGFSDFDQIIGLRNWAVQDILVDGNGIWIATETGLLLYKNGEYTTYLKESGLVDELIWSLYKDFSGNIWAVSDEGINKVVGDSIRSYSFADGIKGTGMHFITQSPDSTIWVGTNSGFSKLMFAEENILEGVINYELVDPYLRETQFLEFDEVGNIWQGTSGGLHFHYRSSLPEDSVNFINGLFFPLQEYGKGLELNYLASHRDNEGNFWFGSFTNGLIKYEGNKMPETQKAPTPIIQELRVNGELQDIESFKSAKLNYNKNNLTFKIGSLYFENPQRVFFKYRLLGFESEWNEKFGLSDINYTNLNPGSYQLEVKTKSIQSDWGEPIHLAALKIEKPFWSTIWFILLAITLTIGLLYFTIRVILLYFEKKKLGDMVAKRTVELRSALDEKELLLKEIHHRVKNNMAIISGLLELQGYKIKDEQAKSAIENSKLRIQTMSSIHEKLYQNDALTNIDFKGFSEDLIERISSSIKGEGKEINLHLDIRSESLSVNTAIPCGLILNELISNCYEHAFKGMSKGNIWVTFRPYVGNKYRLMVKDDGLGVSEDIIRQKRSSLGITLIHSLTSQLKGKIKILSEEGTTFMITIPKEQ
ncbi:MAG: two-component regulator propeller domain-containing protein [Gracilimonas sp.]|nr:two-component regulator propeller domain-containing protein [Gracilimonas sp.]